MSLKKLMNSLLKKKKDKFNKIFKIQDKILIGMSLLVLFLNPAFGKMKTSWNLKMIKYLLKT